MTDSIVIPEPRFLHDASYEGIHEDIFAYFEKMFYRTFYAQIEQRGEALVKAGKATLAQVKITKAVDLEIHMKALNHTTKYIDGIQNAFSRAQVLATARVLATESWRIDADSKAGNITSFSEWVSEKLNKTMGANEALDFSFLVEVLSPAWESLPPGQRISDHLKTPVAWTRCRALLRDMRIKVKETAITEAVVKDKKEKAHKKVDNLKKKKHTFGDTFSKKENEQLDELIVKAEAELDEVEEKSSEILDAEQQALQKTMERAIVVIASEDIKMDGPGGGKEYVRNASAKLGVMFEGLVSQIAPKDDVAYSTFMIRVPSAWGKAVEKALATIARFQDTDPMVMNKTAKEWFETRN